MKAADTYTIEKVGIPSLVLMERAALAAKSPLPPSLQKIQPPCPMVPSRLGQLMPPSRDS